MDQALTIAEITMKASAAAVAIAFVGAFLLLLVAGWLNR